ncbi:helix-turn-helix transcriptional regulator [Lachnospiraceae bacterium ZAX-1]
MAVSYKNLWHLRINRDMKKQNLQKATSIAPASFVKLAKGETATTETLKKICNALACRMEEMMMILPNKESDAEMGENKDGDDAVQGRNCPAARIRRKLRNEKLVDKDAPQ